MVARMMKPLKRLCLALAVPVFLACGGSPALSGMESDLVDGGDDTTMTRLLER